MSKTFQGTVRAIGRLWQPQKRHEYKDRILIIYSKIKNFNHQTDG